MGQPKLVLVLMITAFVFSGSVEAWSWSWSFGPGGWGWGSDGSSSSSSKGGSTPKPGPDPGSSGPGWSWSWGWHWGIGSPPKQLNGFGSTHNNHTTASISQRRKIEVTVWKSGFDYQEWVSKHEPFYINDVLVFKYNNIDQTQSNSNNNNDKNYVYLLQDSMSYKRCDVTKGKKLVARGGSSGGFKLLFNKTHETYYLVNGDQNGCNQNMKFFISPIPHKN